MFYPKKSKEEIERAREKLKEELARERESLRVIKAEEEFISLLKSKAENRWETKPLPLNPQEIKKRELEEAAEEHEKERKEMEKKFDEQIQRKRPQAPGYEYS